MNYIKRLWNHIDFDRVFWCFTIIIICRSDFINYASTEYCFRLIAWIVLGIYYCIRWGFARRQNRLTAFALLIPGIFLLYYLISTDYFSYFSYYNYTVGLLGAILIIQYGLVIKNMISKHKLPRITVLVLLLFLMVLGGMFSPQGEKQRYLVLFLIILPYVFASFTAKQLKSVFYGMIDGLCIGFIICQGYACLHRPYTHFNGAGIRYIAIYNSCAEASQSYLLFYIGYLVKGMLLQHRKEKRLPGIIYTFAVWFMAAFTLAFLYLTGGRCETLAIIAVTPVALWTFYIIKKKRLIQGLGKGLLHAVVLGCCSLVLFPVAYMAIRWIPAYANSPDYVDSVGNRSNSLMTKELGGSFLYDFEWDILNIQPDDSIYSPKYITFEQCLYGTLGRIVPGLQSWLFPRINDKLCEAEIARAQYYYDQGYMTLGRLLSSVKSYCASYKQSVPSYYQELEEKMNSSSRAYEQAAFGIVYAGTYGNASGCEDIYASGIAGNDEYLTALRVSLLSDYDDASERGESEESYWYTIDDSYTSMELRIAIHRYGLKHLNLFGHADGTFQFYAVERSGYVAPHAHNIFLIHGYDYGIISMVFMILTFLVTIIFSLGAAWKNKEIYMIFPCLLVIGLTVMGWFESGFTYKNAYTTILFLAIMLFHKETI